MRGTSYRRNKAGVNAHLPNRNRLRGCESKHTCIKLRRMRDTARVSVRSCQDCHFSGKLSLSPRRMGVSEYIYTLDVCVYLSWILREWMGTECNSIDIKVSLSHSIRVHCAVEALVPLSPNLPCMQIKAWSVYVRIRLGLVLGAGQFHPSL